MGLTDFLFFCSMMDEEDRQNNDCDSSYDNENEDNEYGYGCDSYDCEDDDNRDDD